MSTSPFNKVVFHQTESAPTNINLAVHPFPCDDGLRMMLWRTDYGNILKEPMATWKQRLADALWDGIPGLDHLFFSNGQITIQHNGAFPDADILVAAEAIIRPALEAQLALSVMWTSEIEPAESDYWGRPDSEWWGL